jgi:hypothetical protein
LKALKALADVGLTADSVLANLDHRWIVPPMERRLRTFEMEETAGPVALAQSQLRPDLLPQEYAAMRARCAINLKAVRHSDDDLWSFAMLPVGPLVSRASVFSPAIHSRRADEVCFFIYSLQLVTVNAARSDPPTPRARARVRAAQRQEQERAARKKDKRIRRRERREQRSEEFRLREQLGLSSPTTLEYSSSDEKEEESDGGWTLPERWEPSPPTPRAVEAAEETAPGVGRGSARRQAAYERGGTCRGGAGARRWDDRGCGGGHNVRRAPEEEETGIFHPEVGDRSPTRRVI